MQVQSKTKSARAAAIAVALLATTTTHADNVGQVTTAKQITRQTIQFIGITEGPTPPANFGDVRVNVGDVLTYRIRFTPVPNGATRGLGGYVTDYIPKNTEIVGVRIVDIDGNTVPPHLGGLAQDGVGPRGIKHYPAPLREGSISQLYADTGVFFSTDERTARTPADVFLTVDNGVAMATATSVTSEGFAVSLATPSAASAMLKIVNGTTAHAHNVWDALEGAAWGSGKAVSVLDGTTLRSFNNGGNGNAPFGYGSPVAGPQSHSPFELQATAANRLQATARTGPWRRIAVPGATIGAGDAVTGAGPLLRTGLPADDIGRDVSTANPLPSFLFPDDNGDYTTAVRFAVGELVVGEEYFAEISLRVNALPLDPDMKRTSTAPRSLAATPRRSPRRAAARTTRGATSCRAPRACS
jgi:hypothetical protein